MLVGDGQTGTESFDRGGAAEVEEQVRGGDRGVIERLADATTVVLRAAAVEHELDLAGLEGSDTNGAVGDGQKLLDTVRQVRLVDHRVVVGGDKVVDLLGALVHEQSIVVRVQVHVIVVERQGREASDRLAVTLKRTQRDAHVQLLLDLEIGRVVQFEGLLMRVVVRVQDLLKDGADHLVNLLH